MVAFDGRMTKSGGAQLVGRWLAKGAPSSVAELARRVRTAGGRELVADRG